jgi:hypothetical protein
MIGEKDGTLALTFGPAWRGTLDHWHFDTFRTRFDTPVRLRRPIGAESGSQYASPDSTGRALGKPDHQVRHRDFPPAGHGSAP